MYVLMALQQDTEHCAAQYHKYPKTEGLTWKKGTNR